MANVERVFYMAPSCEIDRPHVDLEKHNLSWSDWGDMEQTFSKNVDTIVSPLTLHFHVDAPNALSWDWYGVSLWGMWSQRAKDLLWPYANGCLRCFQTSLNGTPYYILRVDEELATDCLDRSHSELKFFPNDLNDIMDIKRYAFHREKLRDPLIFHVPERPEILGTQSIKTIVEEAGLNGFRFEDVEHLNR